MRNLALPMTYRKESIEGFGMYILGFDSDVFTELLHSLRTNNILIGS